MRDDFASALGLGARESSIRLVEDWARRNFVTAGGWALEELAIASSPKLQKSAAEGMDAQSYSSATGQYQLYVLKSGLVTRNSDIVKAIKTHGRQAEKLLRQGRGTNGVQLNYVILAGKTNSTFQDGVYRPSSAEFWAEALNLPENDAIELALAMAAEAGQLVKRDASVHLKAMETLVATYLRTLDGRDVLDWDFVSKRNMRDKATWSAEDKRRHKLALAALEDSGYNPDVEEDEAALQVAETVADLEPTPEDVGLF